MGHTEPCPEAPADSLSAVREALRGLSGSFAADGYNMVIAGLERGRLRIVIEAGEGACAECLVPQEIMTGIVMHSLPADAGVAEIDIVYPRTGD